MAKKVLSKKMCLLVNLMFPGGGVIAAGRRISGTIELVLTMAAFAMALAAVFWPIIKDYMIIFADSKEELHSPDLSSFYCWATIAIGTWIWSTVEIIICYKPKPPPLK